MPLRIIRQINPHYLKLVLQSLFAMPFIFFLLQIKNNFGQTYILQAVEDGDVGKIKNFLSGKRYKKRLNKYYYKMHDAHTYERHTLLTAAIMYNQPDIAAFLLYMPGIDIHKTYVFSESSFNHREQAPLEMALKHNKLEIIKMLKDFGE